MDTDLWAANINWIEWSRIGGAQNRRTGNEEDRRKYSDQLSATVQNSKIFVFQRKSYRKGPMAEEALGSQTGWHIPRLTDLSPAFPMLSQYTHVQLRHSGQKVGGVSNTWTYLTKTN